MKWCPNCEKELSQDEIVKAYEYQKGEHVVIGEDEMEAIPGPSAHVIEILDFVSLQDVDPVYYEKSFFLEPREGAEKAYSLLLSSMKREGKVAVAKVAIRAKETLAVVRAYREKYILLETMFWADEVRLGEELNVPLEAADVGEREKAMATALIETLSAEFDPTKYENRQRQAIADLIQKKIQGREVVREPEVGPQVIDLMEALRQSVEKAKGQKRLSAGPEAKPKRRRKASGENEASVAPPPE